MAERMQRRYFQTYIDTGFSSASPSWYVLGEDLEEFNIEMNPDTETAKNILGETTFTHNGYEVSAGAEPFYARVGDALFEKLQSIIDHRSQYDGCKTQVVEVHLWQPDSGTAGRYAAWKQACYVVPRSYGGDTSGYQIPFDVTYVGERTEGFFAPDGLGGGTWSEE